MDERRIIQGFNGAFRFLSNFYVVPVFFEGLTYPTAEHAYQAAKVNDLDIKRAFAVLQSPGTAKKMGKLMPARPGWKTVRIDVMKAVEASKFLVGSQMADLLVGTGDALLVEGNHWHDNFWGDCYCPDCAMKPGQNWLGKILMQHRDEELSKWF